MEKKIKWNSQPFNRTDTFVYFSRSRDIDTALHSMNGQVARTSDVPPRIACISDTVWIDPYISSTHINFNHPLTLQETRVELSQRKMIVFHIDNTTKNTYLIIWIRKSRECPWLTLAYLLQINLFPTRIRTISMDVLTWYLEYW